MLNVLATASTLSWIDYAILAVYFLAMVGIGVWFSRDQDSEEEFLMGAHARQQCQALPVRLAELAQRRVDRDRRHARRNVELFAGYLDHLRRRLRRCRKIHVICDNARFHIVEGSRRCGSQRNNPVTSLGRRVVQYFSGRSRVVASRSASTIHRL